MNAQHSQLIQALLTRMDHLEFRLLTHAQVDAEETRDDVKDLRSVDGRLQR